VKRTELHTFKVMPKRWVVERTMGWMNNGRALSKHYERDSSTGEAKILMASVYYLSKRLTRGETAWEIDPVMEEKIRQVAQKTNNKIAQPP